MKELINKASCDSTKLNKLKGPSVSMDLEKFYNLLKKITSTI